MKITNWSFKDSKEEFAIPGKQNFLAGEFSDDVPDQEIDTILEFWSRKLVLRFKGSQKFDNFSLGKINPDYRKWLKTNHPNWNWRRPFTS